MTRTPIVPVRILALGLMLILTTSPGLLADPAPSTPADPYTYGPASRDGIGKFYMGREISHVMGHRGAGWLERPTREREERTDLLLDSLEMEADDIVVDLGAGTGDFSLPIAKRTTSTPSWPHRLIRGCPPARSTWC